MIMLRDNMAPGVASLLRQMERVMGGARKGKVQDAQNLVYDACEAADGEKAFELLTRAVELDPNNVDAWLGLMNYEPIEDEERIEFLRRFVAMGEKNLPAHKLGRLWKMNRSEVDAWVRSGNAAQSDEG